jgi:hypothetical protein
MLPLGATLTKLRRRVKPPAAAVFAASPLIFKDLLRNKGLAAPHKIDCQVASFRLTFAMGEDAIQ